MRNQAEVEMDLLGAIRTQTDLALLQSVNPTFSLYGPVYELIIQYHADHGSIPPRDVIRSRIESWNPNEGEFSYWLDEYVKVRLVYDARDLIKHSLDMMDAGDPNQAIQGLITGLETLGYEGGTTASSYDGSGAQQRYEKYIARTERFGKPSFKLWGIPTGISAIDGSKEGWMPGELIGFYARPTVGKTWMLLREGVIAWLAGYRVLLISPEMPASQIEYRIDALIAGQLGIPFSHGKARQGDPSVKAPYTQLLERLKDNERWWTVDTVAGRMANLSDIRALYHRYQPDLILIDGVSLLEDEQRSSSTWEAMKNVCYGLKTFATSVDTAIIVSHQAVNSRRGARGNTEVAQGRGDDWVMPSLNDAAFGDAFVQAMSTVFTMAPDRDDPNIRWYSIRKTRERNIEFKPRMSFAWDVDAGRILDMGRHGDDITAIQSEMRELGLATAASNLEERFGG